VGSLPEAQFIQSLLASLAEGIIVYDGELRYQFWNRAMERMTGVSQDEVLGRYAPDVFPFVREHGIDKLLARALAGETVQGPDIPYWVPQTGRQGWQAGSYRPHVDGGGRIVGVVAVIRDITERKRVEEELRRATEEWEQTFDAVPDAVAILDAEHRIVRVNQAMASRLGLAPEQCVGRRCYEVVHGLPEAPPACPHVQTCRDGLEHSAEVCEGRLGGDFLVTTTPRLDAHGELLGAVHVARDITARKRREEELQRSQADLNRAQAVARTGSWRLDVRRNELLWSDETHRIFGIPRGTPLSYEAFLGAVHPDDRAQVDERWQAALRGEPYDIEHRIVVAGDVKWVRERAELECDEHGALLGGFGTVQDITERKLTEAELRATLAEKEAALQDNATLLQEVHHRTKNNLQMLCDMLYLQAETTQSVEGKSILDAASLRIFAFARLHEQLYLSLQRGRVQLCEYLQGVIRGFQQLHPDVPITVDVPTQGVHLDLDRTIHCGLLVNELLTNSLKHAFPADAPGEIGVRLIADKAIVLQVWDRGKGLPADLDPACATSLGLRLVHILSRRLHATVSVEHDGGTRFTIRFPVRADSPVEPRPE
jgi:PAS domain S-box-containing protein